MKNTLGHSDGPAPKQPIRTRDTVVDSRYSKQGMYNGFHVYELRQSKCFESSESDRSRTHVHDEYNHHPLLPFCAYTMHCEVPSRTGPLKTMLRSLSRATLCATTSNPNDRHAGGLNLPYSPRVRAASRESEPLAHTLARTLSFAKPWPVCASQCAVTGLPGLSNVTPLPPKSRPFAILLLTLDFCKTCIGIFPEQARFWPGWS